MASRIRPILLLLGSLFVASAIRAEPVYRLDLHRTFQPGDVYRHSVAVARSGTASSGTSVDFEEAPVSASYVYRARIEVVAVDAAGLPLREIHRDASLVARDEGRRRQMLPDGTVLRVRYRRSGAEFVRDGEPMDRRLTQVMRELVPLHRKNATFAAMIEPPGPVSAGDRWEIDGEAAGRHLRPTGLRVIETGEGGYARLAGVVEELSGPMLEIRFALPLAWVELDLPPNASLGESWGWYEGSYRVPLDGSSEGSVARTQLRFTMQGVFVRSGLLSRPRPWEIASRAARVERRWNPSARTGRSPLDVAAR